MPGFFKGLIYVSLVLIQLGKVCPVFSQQFNFKNYSTEQGLPQPHVFKIYQDKKGFLWVGTNGGGISRFNGYTFTTFSAEDGLIENVVRCINEDIEGKIWIGTDKGISVFYQGKFQNFTEAEFYGSSIRDIYFDEFNTAWIATFGKGLYTFREGKFEKVKEITEDKISRVIQDKKGSYWIGTIAGGLFRIKNNKVTHFTTEHGLSNNTVRSIIADSYGIIWAGTDQGLSRFENEKFQIFRTTNGLVNDIIYSVYEDQKKNIWIGTIGGLSRFNRTRFTNYTTNEGLPSNIVYDINDDLEGNIWLGMEMGGLSKISSNRVSYFNEEGGLSINSVFSILEDNSGNFWFGTMGGGINKYDGSVYTVYNEENGLSSNSVLTLAKDRKGQIWAGTIGEGVNVFDGKSIRKVTLDKETFGNTIFRIIEDSRGRMIFGTSRGIAIYDGKSIINYNAKTGFIDNAVYSLLEDVSGNIWIGTLGKGLFRFDGKYFSQITEKDGLTSGTIYSIIQDSLQNFWLGTELGGVCKMQNLNGKYKITDTLNISDGLSQESIQLLTIDDQQNLWIGTTKGIDKLDLKQYYQKQDKRLTTYGKDEGFTSVECNQNAVFKDSKGYIWVGTIAGATRFDPSTEGIARDIAPLTYITGVRLFFEEVKWDKDFKIAGDFNLPERLKLNHDQNFLTFDFIGISLSNPEKVRYQFRLVNFDRSWLPVTLKNEATYSNLPPGKYTFEVRASNYAGTWNTEPASFSFQITKPFWQELWFYAFLLLLGGGIVFGFISLRTRSLRQIQRELEVKVKQRTAQLESQNHMLQEAYKQIEYKNHEITDSIRYAKKIQEAILPPMSMIRSHLPESFILFMPKDIVSGDFYWMTQNGSKIIIAAVDCTGHGVPGAFMSFVGFNLLNQIVNRSGFTKPGDILTILNKSLQDILRNTVRQSDIKDGMDIALCSLDFTSKKAEFAGAFNPMYHIRGRNLTVIEADRFPVGSFVDKEVREFKNNEISLQKGDTIYLFTDGYMDQFGGPKDKKFMFSRFRQLLLNVQTLNMSEQKIVLYKEFQNWKGSNDQIDDVLIIGIKI